MTMVLVRVAKLLWTVFTVNSTPASARLLAPPTDCIRHRGGLNRAAKAGGTYEICSGTTIQFNGQPIRIPSDISLTLNCGGNNNCVMDGQGKSMIFFC